MTEERLTNAANNRMKYRELHSGMQYLTDMREAMGGVLSAEDAGRTIYAFTQAQKYISTIHFVNPIACACNAMAEAAMKSIDEDIKIMQRECECLDEEFKQL